MAKNPQLIYSLEYFLYKANPSGKYFNHTTFNKLLVELYFRLKEKGLDIKLPYYWYKHGCLADSSSFQIITGTSLMKYEPCDKSVILIPTLPDPSDITISEKEIIQKEADELLGEYPTRSYLRTDLRDEFVDLNYQHAPLEFQKEFRRSFIPHLELLEKRSNEGERSYTAGRDLWRIPSHEKEDEFELLAPKFDPGINLDEQQRIIKELDYLFRLFPRKEMQELHKAYLKWDDTFRLAVKHQNDLLQSANDFWEVFASLLRVKYNENIDEDRILKWKNEFNSILRNYLNKLELEREDLLELEAVEIPYNIETDKNLKKLMKLSQQMVSER